MLGYTVLAVTASLLAFTLVDVALVASVIADAMSMRDSYLPPGRDVSAPGSPLGG